MIAPNTLDALYHDVMSKDDDAAAKRWQAQTMREHNERRARQAGAIGKPTGEQLYNERAADLAAGVLHGERRGRARDSRKPAEYVVVRDSVDLGLDKGMRCQVKRVKGDKLDLYVPALGTTIAGVPYDHRDIKPV